jgi:hypothetical protein
MTNIYNFFKFIEDKEPEYRAPLPLRLRYSPNDITKEDLHVKGDYYDSNNNDAAPLPNGMIVDGNLKIYNTNISSLPKDLKVEENLWVWDTPLADKYTEKKLKKMIPGVEGRIYTKHSDYFNDM